MSLVGTKVKHMKYGVGIVVAHTAAKNGKTDEIKVKFLTQEDEKKFVYPECITKKFLTFVDEKTTSQNTVAPQQKTHSFTKPTASEKEIIQQFCAKYKKAIFKESYFLKSGGGKKQKVFDGKFVEKKRNEYLYVFESESELNYPANSHITIHIGSNSYDGTLVNCEDFTVIISSTKDLGKEVSSIEFSAEPWKLLNSLAEHLDNIDIHNITPIVRDLICNGHKNIQPMSKVVTGQNNAIRMATTQPITFIWGPPGTGKTETLAKIAIKMIQSKKRVLMLSHSNVSVDGAVRRVNKLAPTLKPGTVLRYGYPQEVDILNHDYLTTYNYVLHKFPNILKERNELLRKKKTIAKNTHEYIDIQQKLTKIKNKLLDEEKSAVLSASFVATTVSKAVADKTIYDQLFDAVIFDEASMAYIPQIIFSAGLAKTHFICMGDFSQLPPIIQNNEDDELNKDIFNYCGIEKAVDDNCGHKWLCLLDTQYRMHPYIADFAGMYMYRSMLQSAPITKTENQHITDTVPLPGSPMGLIDLTGLMSVCTETTDHSRINVLSALITFGFALKAAENADVAIITPYNAQSRLLHAMARDTAAYNSNLSITSATVHKFQGSEKGVVLFDTVDCYRQKYPGMMLTSLKGNYANRLFNVAMTRAKGKFLTVANTAFMDNKGLSPSLMLSKVLKKFKHSKNSIEVHQLYGEFTNTSTSLYSWLKTVDANNRFISDINNAKSEIHIDIPNPMVKDLQWIKDFVAAIKLAHKRNVKVIIRAESHALLPDELRPYAIENIFVANPIAIIDGCITWFGEPLSNASFKTEGQFIPTKLHPIIRMEGKHTAHAMYGFLEMSHGAKSGSISGSSCSSLDHYIQLKCKCKKCGSSMKLKKGSKFFLGCSKYPACNHTEFVTTDLVEDYFYHDDKKGKHCPKCGLSLEAKKGQFGIFVRCCGSQKHTFSLDKI